MNHPAARHFKRTCTRIIATGIAVAAVLALSAVPASASAPTTCGARSLSTPFTPWGDNGHYFQLPNGGFESGTTSWTLTGGGSVVTGNETSYIHSTSDTKSLRLPAGATVKSGANCYEVADQTLRMMVKAPTASGAQLKIDAYIETQTASGVNIRTVSTQIDGHSTSWQPSSTVTFSLGQSQMLAPTAKVTFTFTALGGTWQVDDVYVDPFLSA